MTSGSRPQPATATGPALSRASPAKGSGTESAGANAPLGVVLHPGGLQLAQRGLADLHVRGALLADANRVDLVRAREVPVARSEAPLSPVDLPLEHDDR